MNKRAAVKWIQIQGRMIKLIKWYLYDAMMILFYTPFPTDDCLGP